MVICQTHGFQYTWLFNLPVTCICLRRRCSYKAEERGIPPGPEHLWRIRVFIVWFFSYIIYRIFVHFLIFFFGTRNRDLREGTEGKNRSLFSCPCRPGPDFVSEALCFYTMWVCVMCITSNPNKFHYLDCSYVCCLQDSGSISAEEPNTVLEDHWTYLLLR